MRRMAFSRAALAATAFLILGVAGCTQHKTIPKEKQGCAAECTREQNHCVSGCSEDKGNPAVLEDIRGSLCEKRCKEGYEDCVLACL